MNKQHLDWHAPKLVRLVDAPEKNCLIATEIDSGSFGFNGTMHLSDPFITKDGKTVVQTWCDSQLRSVYRYDSAYLTFGSRDVNLEADGPS